MEADAGRVVKKVEEVAARSRERDAAFLAQDVEKIKSWMRTMDVPIPADPMTFQIMMHKTRVQLRSLPLTERSVSVLWLRTHGCSVPTPAE